MPLYPSLQNRLKNQHEALVPIIANTSRARLHFQPAPGKWSAHDNIAHLAKYQPYFIGRINAILATDCPAFERYNADTDPDFETWRHHATPDLLKTLYTDRDGIYNLINNLSEANLNRAGIHKKFGRLTVVQWAEFFLLHEAHHLFTIFRLANDVDIPIPD